jgi:hypothetical protein
MVACEEHALGGHPAIVDALLILGAAPARYAFGKPSPSGFNEIYRF